jgi:hypothetical protein
LRLDLLGVELTVDVLADLADDLITLMAAQAGYVQDAAPPGPVPARYVAEAARLKGWLPDPAHPYLPLVTVGGARAGAGSSALRSPAG